MPFITSLNSLSLSSSMACSFPGEPKKPNLVSSSPRLNVKYLKKYEKNYEISGTVLFFLSKFLYVTKKIQCIDNFLRNN